MSHAGECDLIYPGEKVQPIEGYDRSNSRNHNTVGDQHTWELISLRSPKHDKPIQVTPEPLLAHPNLTSLFKLHPNHCSRTKIDQLINQLYPPPSCDHIQTF